MADEDRVRLRLDNQDVLIAEHYEVKVGILTQPAGFSIRVGHSGLIADLLKKYRPNTPFQLFIRDALQMTGAVDEVAVHGGDGAMLTIEGRDRLAPLHDDFVEEEKSFNDATYFDLVARCLTEGGIEDWTLFTDNAANRKIITGVAARKAVAEPRPVDEILTDAGRQGTTYRIVRQKLGERRYEFLKRHLDHAGLFLWAGADGNFILGAPNPHQPPLYQIFRKRGLSRGEVSNVVLSSYRVSSKPPRYAECVIFARSGGRKYKRTKVAGAYVDEEMFNDAPTGFGIKNRKLVIRDANVHNTEQAEFMARRKLAEGRRASWQLSYTNLGGHTGTRADGGGRAVWAPDTTVHVIDQELDIDDVFWVESVSHQRGPETSTTINLMRPRDCIFGIDD